MSIDVETKDCTQLSDAEIAELADLCAEGPFPHEVGSIGKQVEAWVLITLAHGGAKLKGFAFCTLERIGGTPCVLIGLAEVQRCSQSDTIVNKMIADQLRRAVLAFPDEDVLVGTRFASASGFEAFKHLTGIVPRDDYKATGEERAWGRRLAKRFGIAPSHYDDRAFKVSGDGNLPEVFSHDALHAEKVADYEQFFAGLNPAKGDCLIAFGWAMAEDLQKYEP
jgi:hypothetical protein